MIASIKNNLPTITGTVFTAAAILTYAANEIAGRTPAFFETASKANKVNQLYAMCNVGFIFGGFLLGSFMSLTFNLKLLSERKTTLGKIRNFAISIFTTTLITFGIPRILPLCCNIINKPKFFELMSRKTS